MRVGIPHSAHGPFSKTPFVFAGAFGRSRTLLISNQVLSTTESRMLMSARSIRLPILSSLIRFRLTRGMRDIRSPLSRFHFIQVRGGSETLDRRFHETVLRPAMRRDFRRLCMSCSFTSSVYCRSSQSSCFEAAGYGHDHAQPGIPDVASMVLLSTSDPTGFLGEMRDCVFIAAVLSSRADDRLVASDGLEVSIVPTLTGGVLPVVEVQLDGRCDIEGAVNFLRLHDAASRQLGLKRPGTLTDPSHAAAATPTPGKTSTSFTQDAVVSVGSSQAPSQPTVAPAQVKAMAPSINTQEPVTIVTDGSAVGNPGPGGWACIIRQGPHTQELSGGVAVATNNRTELTAAISGLQALREVVW
jgi:hypothetical protein